MRLIRSSLLTKFIILCVMIYAVVMIVVLQPQITEARKAKEEAAQAVLSAEQTNLKLEEDISKIGTDEAVIEIARERLNMVQAGEVVFIDSNK